MPPDIGVKLGGTVCGIEPYGITGCMNPNGTSACGNCGTGAK